MIGGRLGVIYPRIILRYRVFIASSTFSSRISASIRATSFYYRRTTSSRTFYIRQLYSRFYIRLRVVGEGSLGVYTPRPPRVSPRLPPRVPPRVPVIGGGLVVGGGLFIGRLRLRVLSVMAGITISRESR